MRILRWLHDQIALLLLLFILTCLGITAFSEPVDTEGFDDGWNGPVYQDGRWAMTGIVEEKPITKKIFALDIDLVQIRYGDGKLWAAVGIGGPDKRYESLVAGRTNRQAVLDAFDQPRYVQLWVPGSKDGVDWSACAEDFGHRCSVTRLVEGSQPPILLGDDEEYTNDLSNVFLRSGVYPASYRYGFLTWNVELGRIIEQGLEGG